MVAVAVAADNDRVAVATIATDAGTWGNDGGGGGVADEPDFVYQGGTAQSRKVSTSRIGREYSGGTTRDATATDRRHFLFKINITNYAALLARLPGGGGPAAGIKIGSASSAYYEYYVFGNDNYPIAGGWQILPISPNISGYRDATTGSPTLTAVDYYSLLADFSATSKGENVVIDAIDLGRGLKLTGGDGADTDGVFADFLSSDEGTSNNRWGYVRSLNGIYFCNGELAIGENTSESAVATVFQDSTGQVLVWENGMAETGYHRFRINLGSATTDVDITGATFDSIGEANNTADRSYTTTEDTRLTFEVVNSSGNFNLVDSVVKNCRLMTLTSTCVLDGCDIQIADLTQASAEIENCNIRTTTAANVAAIDDATFGTTTGINNCTFDQEGSGHVFSIDDTLADAAWQTPAGTAADNATSISPAWPAHATDDVGIMAVETQAGVTPTLSVANGFTQLTSVATSSDTRLTVYWARATSGSMAAPTVTGSDHLYGVIINYRGCRTTGNPYDAFSSSADNTSDTSVTFPTLTTLYQNQLVVGIGSRGNDAAGAEFSGYTNANLSSITERFDNGTVTGDGGGLVVFDASGPATAGAIGTTTATQTNASQRAHVMIALANEESEYTLTELSYTGYGADGSTSAVIDIPDTTGQYLFNISGGTTPTFRTDGAGWRIQNTVNVSLNNLIVGSECLIFETADPSNVIMALTADTATETVSYNYLADLPITIRVRKSSADPLYLPYEATGTITNTGFSINVAQQPDNIAVA